MTPVKHRLRIEAKERLMNPLLAEWVDTIMTERENEQDASHLGLVQDWSDCVFDVGSCRCLVLY
jgi:hypothetical protein